MRFHTWKFGASKLPGAETAPGFRLSKKPHGAAFSTERVLALRGSQSKAFEK